jgi:phosphatidylglycerophosphate synthase
MNDAGARRPIATRNAAWAQAFARWLASTSVTPNQISIASIVVAAIAGGAFWMSAYASPGVRIALLIVAALGCQVRLICNLLDGLVAIESGKRAADGAFWNEFPDRISDIFIIVGLGLGAGAPTLAWAAASLAVLTAYTRELGQNCGAPADFSGPMAKPHRMALVTIASLSAIAEQMMGGGVMILTAALWILAVGAAITTALRAMRIVKVLRGDGQR